MRFKLFCGNCYNAGAQAIWWLPPRGDLLVKLVSLQPVLEQPQVISARGRGVLRTSATQRPKRSASEKGFHYALEELGTPLTRLVRSSACDAFAWPTVERKSGGIQATEVHMANAKITMPGGVSIDVDGQQRRFQPS